MKAVREAPEIAGFTYVEPIGSGGFADVHLYEQRLPSRKVAVKVLREPATEGAVLEQFHAEANVMAQLSGHPSIVAIHAADVSDDGRPYLVMEFCPPPTLASRYRTERIDLAEALETGIRIASAVETVHRAGLLHRDIKPHNILTSAFGAPKLTDFGIAGAAGEDAAYGMSVPWSPPESFLEKPPADARVDVYALAATVYSLLAGRTPFEVPGGANDNATLMSRIERQAVPELTRADVPASLSRALVKAMSKNLDARHETALAFGKELQDVQAELGLPQTRVEVFDASSGSSTAPVEEDQRTQIKPISIIIPEVLAASGTLLAPRLVDPGPAHTLAKAPIGAPTSDTQMRGPVADLGDAGAPATGAASAKVAPVGPPHDLPEPAPETRPRWGVIAAASVGVLLAASAVGAAVVKGDGETPERTAFEAKEQPVDAVAAFTPVPSKVVARPGRGRVEFTWRNSEPAKGDRFGLSVSVANEVLPLATVKRESYVVKAAPGSIVCAEVQLMRANGSASQATDSVCVEAGR